MLNFHSNYKIYLLKEIEVAFQISDVEQMAISISYKFYVNNLMRLFIS